MDQIVTTAATAAAKKVSEAIPDLIRKLAGPSAEEIGYIFQDHWKVYRIERTLRLFGKVQDKIRDAGFEPNPVALKLLLPALESASIEDNEDIHTMWANLLVNASNPDGRELIRPLFATILKELTSTDAVFLNSLFEAVTLSSPYPIQFHMFQLEGFYPHGDPAKARTLAVPSKELLVTLDVLERSGLISKRFSTSNDPSPLGESAPVSYTYCISTLGIHFVQACQAPGNVREAPNKPTLNVR